MPPGREEPSARAIDDARSRMMLSFNGLREQLMPGLKSLLKPKQRWKAVLLLVVACSAILAVTVGIGYASGRSKRAAALQAAGDSQQQQTRAGLLPFPGSTGALQLLSDPNLPGWLQELYTHQADSTLITAENTEALLKQLQRALPPTHPAGTPQPPQPAAAAAPSLVTASLASLPAATAQHLQLLSAYDSSIKSNPASSSSSSSSPSQSPAPAAANLQPFIAAAGDVLSYLRHQQSRALLPMLRDFSRNGLQGLAVFAANPTTLRQEVQQLLQPAGLQQWYADAASSRVDPTKAAGQQAAALKVADSTAVWRSRRRLAAAAAAEAPAFDLTSALLSKMQGAAPGAATAPQSVAQSPAHPTPAMSTGQTTGTTAAAAPGSAAAVMGAPAAAAAASPAAYNRAAAAEPAPVPAALAVGVRAVAVPEPEYLALDFEDVGVDGGITDEEMLELAATEGSSSSSSNSSGRVRKQSRDAGSSKRGVSKARTQGGKWGASIQAEAGSADTPKLAEQAPAASLPAADAGSPQQQQQQLSPVTEAAAGITGRSQGVDAAALCNIQQFSPVGLRGVAQPLVCPAPRLRFYSSGGFVFRPLTIPVIFHCLAFMRVLPSSVAPVGLGVEGPDAKVLLPPTSWQASAAAGNLIDQANKAFTNTGIQFKLQEVRHDPYQHSYLQRPNLEFYQSCTYNTAAPAAGTACLDDVAAQAAAAGAAPRAVHVFVSGSRDEAAYCGPGAAAMGSVCRSVAPGYSRARGPWMGHLASLSWREDALPENYVFLSWDSFNPATANSARFANRGGSIFASVLAQHLGLKPTVAATAATAAAASSCTRPQQKLPALAQFCSAFRQGQQPPTSELAAAATGGSCAAAAGMFGVLEPSVPDSCAMSFSARQAAALQAAIAMHRPKLHAACVSE